MTNFHRTYHAIMIAVAILAAYAITARLEEITAPTQPPIASSATTRSQCATDTDCGCIDDCLDSAEPASTPRASDTLPLAPTHDH